MDYAKLKDLVNSNFTVEKVLGYNWKKWNGSGYDKSDRYQEGFQKKWDVDTNKGKLDLTNNQFFGLLEAALHDGAAILPGATFEVKSNGKEGMEVRYYFNEVKDVNPLPDKELNGGISDKDIPF